MGPTEERVLRRRLELLERTEDLLAWVLRAPTPPPAPLLRALDRLILKLRVQVPPQRRGCHEGQGCGRSGGCEGCPKGLIDSTETTLRRLVEELDLAFLPVIRREAGNSWPELRGLLVQVAATLRTEVGARRAHASTEPVHERSALG